MAHTRSRSASGHEETLVQRALAPLYRDPFEGLCEQAKTEPVERCPRCGPKAGASPNAAPCLFESLSLDLLSLRPDKA